MTTTIPHDCIIHAVHGDIWICDSSDVLIEAITRQKASRAAFDLAQPGADQPTIELAYRILAAVRAAEAQVGAVRGAFRVYDTLTHGAEMAPGDSTRDQRADPRLGAE